MRKFLTAVALLSAAAATPALAADGGSNSRGSFHIEGIVGYDAPQGQADASGIVYGIAGGYDVYLGNSAFIGAEAELNDSSADECAGGINRAGDQLCVNAGRDIYVGARIGARVGERARIYAGGGYTNARVNLTYDANLPGTTDDFSIAEDVDGYRLKAGAELDLGRNAFVRAEYRYSNYDELELDRHQLVAAVGIRF